MATNRVIPRGVRKINEHIVQEGRALIITEENEDQYSWSDIPNGSLKVSGTSGLIMVKLAGQSNWVPSNVRLDVARDSNGNIQDINGNVVTDANYVSMIEAAMEKGGNTISIAKDAIIMRENYTVLDLAFGDHQFIYMSETGDKIYGQRDELGFWFALQKGHYPPGRNMLEVIIDDCLFRSAASGGVIEVDSHRFIIPEDLEVGMEITVKYYQSNRIGNPYPRIYFRKGDYNNQSTYGTDSTTAITNSAIFDLLTGLDDVYTPEYAEVGDLWLDFHGSPEAEDGYLGESIATSTTISFLNVTGYPRTLADAQAIGLFEDSSRVGHKHLATDIKDINSILIEGTVKNAENAANATKAKNADRATNADNANLLSGNAIGLAIGNIVSVQSNGKIADRLISNAVRTIKNMVDYNEFIDKMEEIANSVYKKGMILAWYGSIYDIPKGWVLCNGANGTPDLTDKFIMGTTLNGRYACKDVIEAGLPNITGSFKITAGAANTLGSSSGNLIASTPNGAFYRSTTASAGSHLDSIGFNAANSNPIYGKSDTVQPAAVAMYYIMKV